MNNLLALTLAGTPPATPEGENAALRWKWLGEGVLELSPLQGYLQAVVLSAGIHGNETAPIELLDRLVNEIFAGVRPLAVRLLVVLGNPPAMRTNQRYLASDMNRMFGGRYQQFEPSGETARAQQLEQAVSSFFAGEQATRFHYDLHTAIRGSLLPRFGILPINHRVTAPRCWRY
ncbi:Succinylglutamate desuccinylase [Serratia fonticola]|uniref:Succinylglutamate desuccinylase n=1 Tax=Serratia fonticola TaxID=47917 RepID=A0A4V6KMY1_SERFO|nr:Succinylglutamate desuccinylase [Serratia fonticola]